MKQKSKSSVIPKEQNPHSGTINKKEIRIAEQFSGPIPSPDVFREYGKVLPDAPERILKVFEEDSKHVREMDKLSLTGNIEKDRRAQWMAFIIMLASLTLTGVAIVFAENMAPGIITGLASLFITLKVLFSGNKTK